MFFEPLQELELQIQRDSIPDITLAQLHLCGKVDFNFDNLHSDNKKSQHDIEFKNVKVVLQSKREKRTIVPESDGVYCFEA